MKSLWPPKGCRMLTMKEKLEQTLWIGNLPYWVDENYLCLCFLLFDAVPICFHQTDSRRFKCKLGDFVEIIKDPQTDDHSKGYGVMTFKAREDAEKILHTYNGIKVMPGTKDRFFCLKWAFEKPQYEYGKIRTMNVLNDQRQNPARIQFENHMQVQESSIHIRSSSRLLSIPLDLIYDIFLRLPAESIMKLRSTCKAWASMTSTSHFTYQHLKNRMSHNDPIVALKDSNMFIFSTNYKTKSPCPFSILHFRFPYGFVTCTYPTLSNSCNGLVCVSRKDFINVVNPTIRETAQLPKSFAIYLRRGSNTFSVGLGYDDSSDTYKIVRMYGGKLFGTKYEVFTLGGCSDASCNWRQLEQIPKYSAKSVSPVFLNGAIHWLLHGNHYHGNLKSKVILSLDVRTDATCMLPIPDGLENCTLIELGGCLCIIENDHESRKANLYILEDYASCNWIKKHTIENFPKWWHPVATRDGKLLFPTHYYDMKNGTSENIVSSSNYSSQMLHCYDSIYGCAESLISPISYLQRSNNPCAAFPIFGQRWAAQFPLNDSNNWFIGEIDTLLY